MIRLNTFIPIRFFTATRTLQNVEPKLTPKQEDEIKSFINNFKKAKPSDHLKYFQITYSKSSGPGGQHVNTTDSKATLRISKNDWFKCRGNWINTILFDQLMRNHKDVKGDVPDGKKFPFFTIKGDILISSDKTRYRDKNTIDCIEKFNKWFLDCSSFKKQIDSETSEKWKNYMKKENELRLKSKKINKDKKNSKKINLNDY